MNQISDEKIKEVLFNVLCYVDDFCNTNNINYFLAYGTLLGATRHKGFIPWDDDIDIFMPRKDYDRFIELFDNNASNYKLICHENNKNFYIPFGKVYDINVPLEEIIPNPIKIGLSIDIYPIENIPGTYEEIFDFVRSKYSCLLFWTLLAKNCIYKKRIFSKNLKLFLVKTTTFFISRGFIVGKIIKHFSKFKNMDTDYVFVLSSINTTKDIFPSQLFKEKTMLTFNNRQFPVPKNYDEVLKRLYKDYMNLPPENKRISHHGYKLI